MDTSILVNRILSSLSTTLDSTVAQYLKAFGVTKPGVDLPPVFDTKYKDQWKAIVTDSRRRSVDPELLLLLTILDFIKFMRSQKLNPFKDISRNSIIRPVTIELELQKQELKDTYEVITGYLRKINIFSCLTIEKRVIQLSLDKKFILLNFKLVPVKKQLIVKIINIDLKGFLFKTSVPPIQLQTNVKTKPFNSIISTLNTSPSEWLPLISINNFKLYAKIARDALAIRAVIPINFEYIHNSTGLQKLLNVWKKIR
jgi:hypothetical protein